MFHTILEELDNTREEKQILVVDDDPTFAPVLQKVGKRKGLRITNIQHVEDLIGANLSRYDAIILDYFIDTQTRGTDLIPLFRSKPIVLVSRSGRAFDNQNLPIEVNSFVHKKYGAEEILNRVKKLII